MMWGRLKRFVVEGICFEGLGFTRFVWFNYYDMGHERLYVVRRIYFDEFTLLVLLLQKKRIMKVAFTKCIVSST